MGKLLETARRYGVLALKIPDQLEVSFMPEAPGDALSDLLQEAEEPDAVAKLPRRQALDEALGRTG